jgi:hypothetical protein
MGEINIFEFKGFKESFSVIAPLKHGTRWLESAEPVSKLSYSTHRIGELESGIFSEPVPMKGSRKIDIPNPYIVWRDPYECFVSALTTGGWEGNQIWDGENINLDVLMTKNEHYYHYTWQNISKILTQSRSTKEDIKLIHLSELNPLFRIKMLTNIHYDKKTFTFDDKIKRGLTKDELVELCKKWHPELWNNFMDAIELERVALNELIERFGVRIKPVLI